LLTFTLLTRGRYAVLVGFCARCAFVTAGWTVGLIPPFDAIYLRWIYHGPVIRILYSDSAELLTALLRCSADPRPMLFDVGMTEPFPVTEHSVQ